MRNPSSSVHKTLPWLFVLAGILPAGVLAAAPGQVSYQGRLTNSAGNPLNGTHTIVVELFDDPTAGSLLFGPESHSVGVNNGLFTIAVGSQSSPSALRTALQGAGTRWLRLTVNGTTLSQRQQLLSAPYALVVAEGSVGTAELASDSVTSGKILDGQIVNADISGSANIAAAKIAAGSFQSGAYTFPGDVGIGIPVPSFQLQLSEDSAAKPNGGSWANSSDARIKRNVRPLMGALDSLTRLQGVSFEWIHAEEHGGDSGRQGGFIAQDVEKIFPAWVSERPASAGDSRLVNGGKVKTLSLPFEFDALVVEAIKEQQRNIEALSRQNEELARRNRNLEQRLRALEEAARADGTAH
jgi:hypothetical protein